MGFLGRPQLPACVMECLKFSAEHSAWNRSPTAFHLGVKHHIVPTWEADSSSEGDRCMVVGTAVGTRSVLARWTPKQADARAEWVASLAETPEKPPCDRVNRQRGPYWGASSSPTPAPFLEVSKTPNAFGPQTPFLLQGSPCIFQGNL